MLLIEKVLILKSSSIFQETPENQLIELAEILQEEFYNVGTAIFTKGDTGNCMYLIYKGKIRIHDGDHTLAILQDNEILGELAVLDSETRSATATTIEESVLLKLDQEPFYEIIMNNAGVLKGILRTLCKRLRETNIKSMTVKNLNP